LAQVLRATFGWMTPGSMKAHARLGWDRRLDGSLKSLSSADIAAVPVSRRCGHIKIAGEKAIC
jgi:hypothetical protein